MNKKDLNEYNKKVSKKQDLDEFLNKNLLYVKNIKKTKERAENIKQNSNNMFMTNPESQANIPTVDFSQTAPTNISGTVPDNTQQIYGTSMTSIPTNNIDPNMQIDQQIGQMNQISPDMSNIQPTISTNTFQTDIGQSVSTLPVTTPIPYQDTFNINQPNQDQNKSSEIHIHIYPNENKVKKEIKEWIYNQENASKILLRKIFNEIFNNKFFDFFNEDLNTSMFTTTGADTLMNNTVSGITPVIPLIPDMISPSDVGKLYLLEKIYSYLFKIKDLSSYLTDSKYDEIKNDINEAFDHLKNVIFNFELFKDKIGDIVAALQKFVYLIVKKVYDLLIENK